MAKQSFQTLFCQKFHCPDALYEARAFRQCLYWHGKILAPIFRLLNRDFFALDLQFIRYLGATMGLREANGELADFQELNRSRPNFWRTGLRIRVSGRKAGGLAARLFSAQGGRSNLRDKETLLRNGEAALPEPRPEAPKATEKTGTA